MLGKDYDVVIAGAGPVGLTLAIELGRRGARVLIADKRQGLGKLPKMERCNARTMENFRRMGLAEQIRAAGLDNDMPMDVFICHENLVKRPLVHHTYPSVNLLKAQYQESFDGSTPAEPYQLISQYTLEPLLRDVADALPNVDVRFGCEVSSFTQSGSGVATVVKSSTSTETVNSKYLVGCDGAASSVRKLLGIQLVGDTLLEMHQALFRCEDLLDKIPIGRGRHYHIADDKSSFLIVQDDKKHFSLHATVSSPEEMPALFESIVGFPVVYETLYVGKWQQRLMLAEKYSDRRVFLAGDSAHLVIPTGGLGMNTGHGDAVDLGWKLAAVLDGWGGSQLLGSYEAERRPVGARNIAASRKAASGRRKWRSMWRPQITDPTPEGRSIRRALGEVADVEQRWSNDLYGIELGYQYLSSPIINYPESSPLPPEEDLLDFTYTPSTAPGSRLPHIWLDNGLPIQDELGHEFTLISPVLEDQRADELEMCFSDMGVPFRRYSPAAKHAQAVYGEHMMLVRPDLHIAWNGVKLPEDLRALAFQVTGH